MAIASKPAMNDGSMVSPILSSPCDRTGTAGTGR